MGTRRVVGYVRVSTEGQAVEGVSLEAQRRKLTAYCDALDLDLVDVVVDEGVSAKTLARPGLARVLETLDQGRAEGVIVTKLDRLTRSVRDLGDLVEKYFSRGVALLSVADSIDTSTASGRLVLHVLGAVSQWEREAVAERTREALAEVRAQGGTLGGEALGWRRGEDLDAHGRRVVEADAVEVATVERIVSLRAEGLSLRAVAARLEAEGRPTKRGGRWAAEQVRAVLARVPAAAPAAPAVPARGPARAPRAPRDTLAPARAA